MIGSSLSMFGFDARIPPSRTGYKYPTEEAKRAERERAQRRAARREMALLRTEAHAGGAS